MKKIILTIMLAFSTLSISNPYIVKPDTDVKIGGVYGTDKTQQSRNPVVTKYPVNIGHLNGYTDRNYQNMKEGHVVNRAKAYERQFEKAVKQSPTDITGTAEADAHLDYYKIYTYYIKRRHEREVCDTYTDSDGNPYESCHTVVWYTVSPYTKKRKKYGVYKAHIEWGGSYSGLASQKLQKEYDKKVKMYATTVEYIKELTNKSFNMFRFANGKTQSGWNEKNGTDLMGRRALDKDKNMFKNYFYDRDDYLDTSKDDTQYNIRLLALKGLEALLVDEQNQYEDIIRNVQNQKLFRDVLITNQYMNVNVKQDTSNNLYLKVYEDEKSKSLENTLQQLIKGRLAILDKLNRNIANGNKRLTLVEAANAMIEAHVAGIKSDEQLPQMKRLYQATSAILAQTEQAFNLIAQNQLSMTQYDQIELNIMKRQNSEYQEKMFKKMKANDGSKNLIDRAKNIINTIK